MLHLCQELISLTSDGDRASCVVEFSKTITIADVVVLDRACSFSLKSVMGMVRRIDSAEKEADSGKLTEFIRKLLSASLKAAKLGLNKYSDSSVSGYLGAPIRLLPRPVLQTHAAAKRPLSVASASKLKVTEYLLYAIYLVNHFFALS